MVKKKYHIRNEKQSYRFSILYYIEKYGEIEGNIKWKLYKKNVDKTSLKSFVKRYGDMIGKSRYNEYINNLRYRNSLNYFVEKYDNIEGKIKWDEYRDKTIFKKQKYSKISQDLFWLIYEKLDEKQKDFCMFAELNNERFIKTDKSIFFIDFVVKNVAIEFDGSYWHSLENVKKRDLLKTSLINHSGYSLLRIPENDFLKNKDDVIIKCVEYIKLNYDK